MCYATQGAALLDRIAEEYQTWTVKQSRYGAEIRWAPTRAAF